MTCKGRLDRKESHDGVIVFTSGGAGAEINQEWRSSAASIFYSQNCIYIL
jgi:hypothetical protein